MTNYTLPSTTISPYAPIENLAKPPRRSMSRVLSRCLSLNRKSISSGPSDIHSRSGPYVYSTTSTGTETEDQAIFRPSAQKAVRVDRDHEAIPRVASTHLARAQSQSGVAYKEIGKGGLTESQSSAWSTKAQCPHTPQSSYPYYSHFLSDQTASQVDLTQRRPSVQTKLSRGQIANFRKASASSSIPSDSTQVQPPQQRRDHHQPRPISLISQTSTSSSVDTTPKPAPHRHRHRPCFETDNRRHLASSRSSAEMKGRSPTTPTRIRMIETPSFETSTPHSTESTSTPAKFPFICPDKLIARPRPAQIHPLGPPISGVGAVDLGRPLPPTPSTKPAKKSAPPMSADLFKLQRSNSSAFSSTPTRFLTPRKPVPAVEEPSPEALDTLFSELYQACQVEEMIPLKSGDDEQGHDEKGKGDSPIENDTSPEPLITVKTPATSQTRFNWGLPGSELQTELPIPGGFPPASDPSEADTGIPKSVKRFVPTQSLELSTTRLSLTPRITSTSSRPVVCGKENDLRSEMRVKKEPKGRVKDAIARLEQKVGSEGLASPAPITPVRALGEIIARPNVVDSNGLSAESRRLSKSIRQQ